jgi:hypothetical protein
MEMEVDEEEEGEDDEDDQEENDEEQEGEDRDESIEEGGEEDDDMIVIDDEDDGIILIDDEDDEIKVEPKQEVKQEVTKEKTTGIPPANEATPREETLEEKLQKANVIAYKFMAGILPNQIGPTLEEWDTDTLLKMVQMAEQEIRQHPAKFI